MKNIYHFAVLKKVDLSSSYAVQVYSHTTSYECICDVNQQVELELIEEIKKDIGEKCKLIHTDYLPDDFEVSVQTKSAQNFYDAIMQGFNEWYLQLIDHEES
jgi:hypothetical protein